MENTDEKKKIMEKWYFENAKKIIPQFMEKWLKILDEQCGESSNKAYED